MLRIALRLDVIFLNWAALCCAATAAPLPSPAVAGTFTLDVKSGSWDRLAYVHVPKGFDANKKLPLVLVFHGAGGNGEMMLSRYGWAAMADKEGFIVASPEGLPVQPKQAASFLNNPRIWRSGPSRRRLLAAQQVDDVEFTRVLLDELKTRVPYDEERVFVAGHSNGGGMTFKLGAELSERFTALGMVAGTMDLTDPRPKKPLPTLYIIGTRDPLVPLEGGEVKLPWFTRQSPPVAEFLEKWAKALGCETKPQTISEKDGLKREEYAATKGDATLNVLYIEGHGHQWPGAGRSLPASLIGPMTEKLNATEVIWEFFEQHGGKQD